MGEVNWRQLVDRAIRGELIRPAFQPIVDIQRGVIAGYEALARFDDGPVAGPDEWLARAFQQGRLAELDAASLRASLAWRDQLPRNTFLSVNVEPVALVDPIVMRELQAHAPLDGLVLELTEHGAIPDLTNVEEAVDRLRALGALIAVDDAGAGYSGLQQILDLRPQILKLDRSLVTGIDTDEAKAALVEMVGVFANRIDAWVIAEGVETAAEAERCRRLGVPLAQGWYYAAAAPPFLDDADLPAAA
jgi:EAL domain-containing protein (putative c-di-GMP-specific phosphodiesterase class I)